MSSGLHRIEDDLAEDALESWAAQAVAELELVLARHAAFDDYLRHRGEA